MNSPFRPIFAIFYKDFVLEFRTKETLSSMLIFAVLVMVIFNFAFEQERQLMTRIAPGVLWVAILFSGVLGLNRSFAQEKEFGALEGTLLAPVDRGAIYLGKMLASSLFLIVTELILFPVFEIFFNVGFFARFHLLLPVIILATLGFSALGTVFSAVAMNTRMKEVMLPILLLPMSVPVMIAAVESTSAILAGQPVELIYDWLKILSAFFIVSLTASYLLFEFVLVE